jgi:hypothetical protein
MRVQWQGVSRWRFYEKGEDSRVGILRSSATPGMSVLHKVSLGY